jgi:methionyl-tRNA formyltransferase
MRIVFFGASELGYDCCEEIIKAGFEVVGIFTIPQEFNISYSPGKPVKNYLHKDFFELGKKFNIPVFSVNQNIKMFEDDFKRFNADFILAIGWYYMLPANMIKLASKGAAGIHASLLPKYRGNAPLVWAMINGETETGISFFYFEKGVDEGDIIAQEKFSIDDSDTIKTILNKTQKASIDVLLKNLPLIANGTNAKVAQDHSKATMFPKRSPEDGLINWSWENLKIKDFIRAQTKPYPGAFTFINGKKVIIWDADILDT